MNREIVEQKRPLGAVLSNNIVASSLNAPRFGFSFRFLKSAEICVMQCGHRIQRITVRANDQEDREKIGIMVQVRTTYPNWHLLENCIFALAVMSTMALW